MSTKTKEKKETELVIFKLLDRKEIGESKHDSGQDKKIDFPVWHGIKNPTFITDGKGNRRKIRYVKGADSVFVDEQDKRGDVYNPNIDIVGFESGNDIIVSPEFDNTMIEFLRIHPTNPGSPYHNPKSHPAIFEEYSHKKSLQGIINSVELEDEALGIVRSLKSNSEGLRKIAPIFGVSTLGDDGDIYIELRNKAIENPEVFITSIANKKNAYLSNVRKAVEYNVIVLGAKGYQFTENNAVISIESKNEDELVEFLNSEEGDIPYRQILLKVRQKEVEKSEHT